MRAFALALVLALALAMPAAAQECTPTTSAATLTVHAIGGIGYYVVEDPGWLTCEFGIPECGSIWVYEEANGIAGVQRADDVHDDTCTGQIPGDRLVV
jgi:hypothetical protein